jgi:CRP/FNR family transcriptional regulator
MTAQASGRTDRLSFVPGVHGSKPSQGRPDASSDVGPLVAVATHVEFEAGASLLMEGDVADHLFRITSGLVKVYRTLPDGRCQITGFLFAGDFVGLTPEDHYLSGVVAVGAVTASRFPRKKVDQLVEVSPLVARLLLRRTCGELIAAQDQMLLLGRKTAVEKLASFLLMIERRLPGDVLTLPMTRVDIADYLGLTIETVSRTLTQLRESDVIAVDRAQISILDAAVLDQLAEGA